MQNTQSHFDRDGRYLYQLYTCIHWGQVKMAKGFKYIQIAWEISNLSWTGLNTRESETERYNISFICPYHVFSVSYCFRKVYILVSLAFKRIWHQLIPWQKKCQRRITKWMHTGCFNRNLTASYWEIYYDLWPQFQAIFELWPKRIWP